MECEDDTARDDRTRNRVALQQEHEKLVRLLTFFVAASVFSMAPWRTAARGVAVCSLRARIVARSEKQKCQRNHSETIRRWTRFEKKADEDQSRDRTPTST